MASTAGKIDAFVDCVSLYSYYAISYLLNNKDALLSHGVEVELHPIFLGGIMNSSGMQIEHSQYDRSLLSLKSKYLRKQAPMDESRKGKTYKIRWSAREKILQPSKTTHPEILPYRDSPAHHPRQTYESTFLSLWQHIYEQETDISKPPNMAKALSSSGFNPDEVREILAAANDPKYKEMLLANTQKAIDYGAFGAPWFWVRNARGKEEPFFGSDRFHYIYDFLGVPFQDIAIKEKGKL
ncbi:hypothetical protein GP486_000787 [Trichoglossum hirsutum]|uniref:Glutathione S-transferase kappa 1 n=1 Tax=Trichoglossum hirsutum TaxID=265104 RepID=A0A9P8RTQ4_9PEZI|nr:hypothetical protein GP486_000787 [Trichoglossum hirsutum]